MMATQHIWLKEEFAHIRKVPKSQVLADSLVLLDFSLTVKAAPHECVIRTGQP